MNSGGLEGARAPGGFDLGLHLLGLLALDPLLKGLAHLHIAALSAPGSRAPFERIDRLPIGNSSMTLQHALESLELEIDEALKSTRIKDGGRRLDRQNDII